MIKMDYGDNTHRKYLESEYKKLLNDATERDTKWQELRKKLIAKGMPCNILPKSMTAIMVLPYPVLVQIYEKYIASKIAETDKDIHKDLVALFSYESNEDSQKKKYKALRSSIAKFFTDDNNGFEIHTCHYCDMAYINYFKKGKEKRVQFDLDHVLDKGRCPIVALSLYNFVPCCPTCNSRMKSSRQMQINLRQRQKLSPTTSKYKFDKKVKIWVKPTSGNVHTVDFLKHHGNYAIEFDTSADPDYANEIDLFYLDKRYNYHKCEALRLMDLKAKYTPQKIQELAKVFCSSKGSQIASSKLQMTIEMIKADIFNTGFMSDNHRAFGKLNRDILGKI